MADRAILKFNGNWFEQQIERRLDVEFSDAVFVHDCSLYSNYLKKDTQIDIIMLHKSGIYVIEAKNWNGYLKGEYNDARWTGKSSDPIVKTIVNPIDQNFVHIRTLKNALRMAGYHPGRFESFVCVPDRTSILSKCSEMCCLSQLVCRIRVLAQRGGNLNVEYWKQAIQSVCQ